MGIQKQLTATVEPNNATNKAVTWTTSNAGVATVSNTGLVTAKGEGWTTVRCTTADGGHQATCTVTVTGGSVTPVTTDFEIAYTREFSFFLY
jgi:uncharacterized protein YjdB